MLFRHATSNKTAAQLKRSVFFSEYACRRMEIATWGLFMKGKFRSSQMCSNFSKQLKLHNSISELSCCKAPVCKYLPPKSLFFFVSVISTIADNTPKNYAGRFSSFLFCSFYTLTLVSLAYFICLISRCQNYKKQQVFSNILNRFWNNFYCQHEPLKDDFSGLSW